MIDNATKDIMTQIMESIFEESKPKFESIRQSIIDNIMIPITTQAGKVANRILVGSYDVQYRTESNSVIFTLMNDATDPSYPNKFYWNIVDSGRKRKQRLTKGTKKNSPFTKSLTRWADAKGFTGSIFWLAVNINDRGINGRPEIFESMVNKSEEFIVEEMFK